MKIGQWLAGALLLLMFSGCAVDPRIPAVENSGATIEAAVAATVAAQETAPAATATPVPAVTASPQPSATEPAAQPTLDLPKATNKLPQPTVEVPPPLDISYQGIKGATLVLPVLVREVKLEDGKFSGTGDAGEEISAELTGAYAEGDLNGDGMRDAAVLLREDAGGSGSFVSLGVFLNDNGAARPAAWAYIDDRPQIKAIWIAEGEVIFEGVIHEMDDPMIEPTLVARQAYRLVDDQLVLVRQASALGTGVMNEIRIDQPLWESEVGDSVQLSGNMPVAPFENNLALSIQDEFGAVIHVEGFMVEAEDLGGLATFDQTVDLSLVPQGRFWLELAAESPRDGTVLQVARVLLTRQ